MWRPIGTSPLSAEHDALRMKSKRASRGQGLYLKSNPKKGVGAVQTTVQDALTGVVLQSRYTPYGESAGDLLLLVVMKLARVDLLS
jgi:hypothetical protein